jgi:hypothetical protein
MKTEKVMIRNQPPDPFAQDFVLIQNGDVYYWYKQQRSK